ncbi:MAG: hypothetical protein AAFU73_11110 [Planctomycetota bacterium]
MKALIPLAIGLALVACTSEPVDNGPADTNSSQEVAPKAKPVAFTITGMT